MDQKNKSFIILAIGLAVGAGVMWSSAHFPRVSAALSGGYFSFNGNRLSNVGAPTASTDAATESYVLGAAAASVPANWTCTTRTMTDTLNPGQTATASCVGSEKVVAGGCSPSPGSYAGTSLNIFSYPATGSQGWRCEEDFGTNFTVYVWAQCCQ